MENLEMKNVYILAARNNVQFAKKLLSGIKNVKIARKTFDNEKNDLNMQFKKDIESADIILAVIDDKFAENKKLEFELYLAQMLVHESGNKLLVPIVLNKAKVPKEIERLLYIPCDSESEDDLNKIQQLIEKLIIHGQYNIKKRSLKDNNNKTAAMIIITIAIEIFAALFLILSFKAGTLNRFRVGNENFITIILGIMLILLAMVTLFTSYLSIIKRRWQEEDEEELASYSRRLKQAVVSSDIKQEEQQNNAGKKEVDALERMMINLEDIKEFYTWSQKQAKAAFILAVSMCISGFILIIAASLLPVVFKLGLEMSTIPAIGGVITELIAGTALVVYRNSLAQLNHYHKALHEDERFLSSVNLLGKFTTDERRDDMLQEIIRSEIQMNLDGLAGDEDKEIK